MSKLQGSGSTVSASSADSAKANGYGGGHLRSGRQLDSMNWYAQTIEDPVSVTGVGIPDLVTTQSACFSILDRQNVTTGAAGIAVIVWGSGYNGSSLGSLIPNNVSYTAGTTCGGAAVGLTPATLFGTATATNFSFGDWSSSSSLVPVSYDTVRLVSAAATFMWLGTTNSSGGKMSAVFIPKYAFASDKGSTDQLSINQLEAYPGAVIVPLSPKGRNEINLRYRPLDDDCLQYSPTGVTVPVANNNLGRFPGVFICAVTGASTAGGSMLQGVYHGNYEGQPNSANYDTIKTYPSYSDDEALSRAFNKAATMDTAVVSNSFAAPKAPTASSVTGHIAQKPPKMNTAPEKTIVEKVLDSLPVALGKGADAAARIGPLIAALG